jgi:hypothetical protein
MVTRKSSPSTTRPAPAKNKPVARAPAPAKTAKPSKPAAKPVAAEPKAAAPAKPHKQKLVRDSFTIPRDEYAELANLKQRAAKLGRLCKKSEVLRAGLKALVAMSDANLLTALQAVPSLKTGRPTAEKKSADSAGAPAKVAAKK